MNRRAALIVVLVAGCNGTIDGEWLRVEPARLDLDLALDAPRAVSLQVLRATDGAFSLVGAPVGELAGAELMISARTGGVADVTVTHAGLTVTVPVVVHLTSTRVDPSAPGDAPQWFAAATDTAYDAHLEPADRA